MQVNKLGYDVPIALYIEVPKEQHEELLLGRDGCASFSTDGDWSSALSKLEEFKDDYDLVPVLLGDPGCAGKVRWLAVLDSIQEVDNRTLAAVTCLEELSFPLPLLEMTRYGAGTPGLSPELTNGPIICITPEAVLSFLVRNEILPGIPHPLLFEKCVVFYQTPIEILRTKSGDFFSVTGADSQPWDRLVALLHEAELESQVLNAIFPDPAHPSSVGWVVIVRDVEIKENATLITYQTMYDFREIEPRFPTAIFLRENGVAEERNGGNRPYEVRQQSWLVNDCLNELSRETTASEFEQALSIAKLSAKQRAMLCYHHSAPNQTMSMGRLADLMGFKNFNAANMHYGKLAGNIGKTLGSAPEGENICVFAYPTGPDESGHFQWKMRPQLAEALENLGWVSREG